MNYVQLDRAVQGCDVISVKPVVITTHEHTNNFQLYGLRRITSGMTHEVTDRHVSRA